MPETNPLETLVSSGTKNAATNSSRWYSALEQGGLDLDASLQLWERGEKLAKRCEEHLAGARKRVEDALAADDAEGGSAARADPRTRCSKLEHVSVMLAPWVIQH